MKWFVININVKRIFSVDIFVKKIDKNVKRHLFVIIRSEYKNWIVSLSIKFIKDNKYMAKGIDLTDLSGKRVTDDENVLRFFSDYPNKAFTIDILRNEYKFSSNIRKV